MTMILSEGHLLYLDANTITNAKITTATAIMIVGTAEEIPSAARKALNFVIVFSFLILKIFLL
jgi:hypothetical protein